MQVDLDMAQMNNLSFRVRLVIYTDNNKSAECQSSSFSLDGVQLHSKRPYCVPDSPEFKHHIDKKIHTLDIKCNSIV